jgi:hypothetical protein
MIRPRRSASLPALMKHGDRSKDRRQAAYTVSCLLNATVSDDFTSRKWFVSLTGEVPTRPRSDAP